MKELGWWPKQEVFHVFHVAEEGIRGFSLALNQNKRVRVSRETEYREGSPNFAAFVRQRRAGAHTIIAADSSLAFTVLLPLLLERDQGAEPLETVEFENLLAQAVGRVFAQCRNDASRALGFDDLDMVVAYSRIGLFKVDGHRVVNPIGFRGDAIHAVLELTFTTRQTFERLRRLVPGTSPFFFTEVEKAELAALRKIESLPVQLLSSRGGPASFFRMTAAAAGNALSRGTLDWSPASFEEQITRTWDVSNDAARSLYHTYLARAVSPPLERFFRGILKSSLDDLLEKMEHAKLKGRIYVDIPCAFPVALPYRRRGIELRELPFAPLVERLGFNVSGSDASHLTFRNSAPFFEYYTNKGDSEIEHWLRRRLQWLGSPGQ